MSALAERLRCAGFQDCIPWERAGNYARAMWTRVAEASEAHAQARTVAALREAEARLVRLTDTVAAGVVTALRAEIEGVRDPHFNGG